jgi:putative aldouronate transport system permease protein
MVPLAVPGIATITLFNTLMYWNDWWLGLMLINGNEIIPLQLYLLRIIQKLDFLAQSTKAASFASNGIIPAETVRMAICILAIGPIILVYPFFQKHIVKGLLIGSIKG